MVGEVAEDVFRLDNDVLAFRFTATLSDRAAAAPLERLTTPERLGLWLGAAGIGAGRRLSGGDLEQALGLREAIYRLGASTARGTARRRGDLDALNAAAAAGRPVPVLSSSGWRWALAGEKSVTDALSVIARDAVTVLGGAKSGRVKTCDGPGCAGLYLDTSRGNNRRWCSMNSCGNKNKKTRMRDLASAGRNPR